MQLWMEQESIGGKGDIPVQNTNATGENGLLEYFIGVDVHLKIVCPRKIKATLKVPNHSLAGKKTSCARLILVHLCGRRAAPPEILVNATAGVRKECKYCENCNGKQSQKKTLRFTLALTQERDQGYVDLNESMPNWKWIGR